MSVLIDGFKMPNNCDECPFYDEVFSGYPTCSVRNVSIPPTSVTRDSITVGTGFNPRVNRMSICPMHEFEPAWVDAHKHLPKHSGMYQVLLNVPNTDPMLKDPETDKLWDLNYVDVAFFDKNQGEVWIIDSADAFGSDLTKYDCETQTHISHWAPLLSKPEINK